MRYKIITKEIHWDDEVWQTGETLREISKRTGINYTLLSQLKNDRRVIRFETFKKYKDLILGKPNSDNTK